MPMNPAAETIESKWQRLLNCLKAIDRPAVLFSGGVDSTLLLHACRIACGQEAVAAVTAMSPLMTAAERQDAGSLARELGIRHVAAETDECASADFCANPKDRCAICKRIRLRAFLDALPESAIFLDGENADDVAEERPGRAVSDAFGVRHPLLEAGLSKADIRRLAKQADLRVWDRPANACLATRIPCGQRITRDKLHRIEICENHFRKCTGIRVLRVRHDGSIARIEMPVEDMRRLKPESVIGITDFFRNAGFDAVLLDLEGYRSGGPRMPLSPSAPESIGANP